MSDQIQEQLEQGEVEAQPVEAPVEQKARTFTIDLSHLTFDDYDLLDRWTRGEITKFELALFCRRVVVEPIGREEVDVLFRQVIKVVREHIFGASNPKN